MNAVSKIWRNGCNDIVRGYGLPNTLERKLPDLFSDDSFFDCREDTRANENLARLSFIAKTRGDVGDRANCGVIEAPLKADSAERSISVRYTDAKADIVAKLTPPFSQCANRNAHFQRHLHGL